MQNNNRVYIVEKDVNYEIRVITNNLHGRQFIF